MSLLVSELAFWLKVLWSDICTRLDIKNTGAQYMRLSIKEVCYRFSQRLLWYTAIAMKRSFMSLRFLCSGNDYKASVKGKPYTCFKPARSSATGIEIIFSYMILRYNTTPKRVLGLALESRDIKVCWISNLKFEPELCLWSTSNDCACVPCQLDSSGYTCRTIQTA